MTEITSETLELAALAAGMPVRDMVDMSGGLSCLDLDGDLDGEVWRPHLDDGDAARLAVRLRIYPHWGTEWVAVINRQDDYVVAHDGTEPDTLRAWREAVVLCAAEVGRRIREGGR